MKVFHTIERYRDVDGFLTPQDVDTLQEFAAKTDSVEGNAIEIGAYKGLSAVVILDGLPKQKRLVSLDINTHPEFHEAIKAHGHQDRSELVLKGFREYLMEPNYSFVFIDHNHSYIDNMDCFRILLPRVSSGGFILFHDVGHEDFVGVEDAVNEIIRDYFSIKLIRKGFTTVFQKA